MLTFKQPIVLLQLFDLLFSSCQFIIQLPLNLFSLLDCRWLTKRKGHVHVMLDPWTLIESPVGIDQKMRYLFCLLGWLLDPLPDLFSLVQLHQVLNDCALKLTDLLLHPWISKKIDVTVLELTYFLPDLVVNRIYRQLYFFVKFYSQSLYLLSHPFDFPLVLLFPDLLTFYQIFDGPLKKLPKMGHNVIINFLM